MNSFISIEDLSLQFRIYRNANPSLKDLIIGSIYKQRKQEGYTEFFALKNISLDIKPGDRIGIVGLNGAGKSTLLKTIAGIYTPYSGSLKVNGKVTPLMDLSAGFDPEQTGRENIYLYGALMGISPEHMKEKEQAIADFSELKDFLDLPIKYYSSGMQGRLAFSIATAIDPEILLVDEVFATGDSHFVKKSIQRIMQMIEQSQILVMVSHSSEYILQLCNRAVILEQGKLVGDGKPEDIINEYNRKIAELDTR